MPPDTNNGCSMFKAFRSNFIKVTAASLKKISKISFEAMKQSKVSQDLFNQDASEQRTEKVFINFLLFFSLMRIEIWDSIIFGFAKSVNFNSQCRSDSVCFCHIWLKFDTSIKVRIGDWEWNRASFKMLNFFGINLWSFESISLKLYHKEAQYCCNRRALAGFKLFQVKGK